MGKEIQIAITGDTHFASPSALDQPVSINDFATAFRKVTQENPDIIIHTGDITSEGSLEIAERLSEALQGSDLKLHAILGNRDLRNKDIEPEELRESLKISKAIDLLDESVHVLEKEGRKIVTLGMMGISGGFGRSVLAVPRNDPFYYKSEQLEIEKAHGLLEEHLDADMLIVVSHYPLLVRDTSGRSDIPTKKPSKLADFLIGLPIKDKVFVHGHFHEDVAPHKIGKYKNINGSVGIRSGEIFSQHTLKLGQ